MMQPGYAWIDKRYLHTYTQFLPREIVDRLRYKTLYEAASVFAAPATVPCRTWIRGCRCLAMTDFYNRRSP
jgi:hypothetical protein